MLQCQLKTKHLKPQNINDNSHVGSCQNLNYVYRNKAVGMESKAAGGGGGGGRIERDIMRHSCLNLKTAMGM